MIHSPYPDVSKRPPHRPCSASFYADARSGSGKGKSSFTAAACGIHLMLNSVTASQLILVSALVLAVVPPSAVAQPNNPKLFIAVDMEGVAGVVTGDQLTPKGFEYERFDYRWRVEKPGQSDQQSFGGGRCGSSP